MLYADVGVGLQAGAEGGEVVPGESGAVGGALAGGGAVDFDFDAGGHCDFGEGAFLAVGQEFDFLAAGGVLLGGEAGGVPAVALPGYAAEGLGGGAADP